MLLSRRYLWSIWCGITTALLLAGLITLAVVYGTARTGPVHVAIGKPYDITPQVPVGGRLSYTVDFDLRESCAGDIVAVYRSLKSDKPHLSVQRRPVAFQRPQTYRSVPISREIPKDLTPGWWSVTIYRESQCTTRRQVDPIGMFDFEVVSDDGGAARDR